MPASAFDYEQGLNNLAFQDAENAGMNAYARFRSARDYRRNAADAQRSFRSSQPQFGAHYAGRGMLNSGVYKGDNRERFRQYQDLQTRMAEGQMEEQTMLQNQQAMTDQNRIRAMLNLFEKYNADRASEDPFATFYNPFEMVAY